jgi:predicted phosphodiesterase
MRVQYCSDLHLEFDQNNRYLTKYPLPVRGDILILAGDIVPLHDEFFSNPFFNFISRNYRQIFWVAGNHEFYYNDISDYSQPFNIKLLGNINIVNNIELKLEGTRFVFSTLWSKIDPRNEKIIEQSVADFECITINKRRLRSADFNKLHADCLQFINSSLNGFKGKTVVVTHHLPSVLCNAPAHSISQLNDAFCVDLTGYIEKCNASFWIYGHSHYNQKPIHIGKTILLTNQLGYVQQNEHYGFRNNAYFSL